MAVMCQADGALHHLSVETLMWRVRWDHPTEPDPELPSVATASVAFTPYGTDVLNGDFQSASWLPDPWTTVEGTWWLVEATVGPATPWPLTPGQWWSWVRVVMGAQSVILGPFGPTQVF